MSGGGPEWISVTVVDVVIHSAAGLQRARCQVGIARTPDGVDHIASRLGRGPWVLLPPVSAALAVGALRDGIIQAGGPLF